MADRFVADESWSRIGAQELLSAGYSGIIGYCSHDKTGKNLTSDQVSGYSSAGLEVGLVWETGGQRASEGSDAGTADGKNFVSQAQAVGATGGCLFMVAEDPTRQPENQWPNMDAYFAAAGPILRNAGFEIGGYGSEAYLVHAKGKGLIDRQWLVGGWSDNVAGDLMQQSNNPGLSTFGDPPNNQIDCNYVVAEGDWGQVQLEGAVQHIAPAPAPPPAAAPAPASGRNYTVVAGDTILNIAPRFNVTPTALADANNIVNPADVVPGLVLQIPG